MIEIQRSEDRGRTRTGWLDSRHSFSFGHYWNPARTGFGPLLVLNEDSVRPGTGFGPHPHRDMEILTFVVAGELRHRDSLGSESSLPAGTAQAMRAGTGIVHSEWNASDHEELQFMQIWLQARQASAAPAYSELEFRDVDADRDSTRAQLRTIASADGRAGSLTIDQDAVVSVVTLPPGETLALPDDSGRFSWLQVLEGSLALGAHRLDAGDGVAVRDESEIDLKAETHASAILLDLHGAD
jgi:redox-sensitive bicupin YhaK (pirin superfamily)